MVTYVRIELSYSLEEKISEALGLEMAAQKAVQQLVSNELLGKRGIK